MNITFSPFKKVVSATIKPPLPKIRPLPVVDTVSFTAHQIPAFYNGFKANPCFALQDYKTLNPEEKDFIREEYQRFPEKHKTFVRRELFHYGTDMPLNDKEMKEVVSIAQSINQQAKENNADVFALGRGSNTFLETAKALKNGIEDYQYLGFSSIHFYQDDHEPSGYREMASYTPENIEKDRALLAEKSFIPSEIVESGKNVLVVNYTNGGNRLYTFNRTMQDWAKEQGVLPDFDKALRYFSVEIPTATTLFAPKSMAGVTMKNSLSQALYVFPYGEKQDHYDSLRDKDPDLCREFSNLIEFRIYDYLEQQGLLKT